jgi:hypothetical protein
MGEMKIAYKILVRKPEERKPRGRCRHSSEDNIKMDLIETGCECCGMDSFGSGQGSVTGFCEHGNETKDSINVGEFLGWLSDCHLEDGCHLGAGWRHQGPLKRR